MSQLLSFFFWCQMTRLFWNGRIKKLVAVYNNVGKSNMVWVRVNGTLLDAKDQLNQINHRLHLKDSTPKTQERWKNVEYRHSSTKLTWNLSVPNW